MLAAIVDERPGAVRAPVEHAIVAGVGRHLHVADVARAAGEQQPLLDLRDARVEVPRKGKIGSRASERSLAR
ncbi:hypothetical protein D3C83_80410 [compost metagenome]